MEHPPFTYQETHRVVRQAGNQVYQSSENLGWPSLFASIQSEAPYKGYFPGIKDHLVVLTLKQPVRFMRRICGELQEQLLAPGSITITPGGADFTVQTATNSAKYDTIHLYVRDEMLRETHAEMFETVDQPSLRPSIGTTDTMIHCIASEIGKILLSPEASDQFYADTLSRTLASCLVRHHVGGRSARAKISRKLTTQQISRAIEYIEQSLCDALKLPDIAKAAGVNTVQLSFGFRNYLNLTPYEYVIKARVERAKHLLVMTDLPLAEIAVQCGFSHQQHMTRMVRQLTGATPGSIRRER